MARVFLGLGSNLGEREKNIQNALQKISQLPGTKLLKVSNNYETEPIGPKQNKFINAAAVIETALSPEELLVELKLIEKLLGRVQTVKWGPRLIDLDILAYEDLVLNSPNLTIPHPLLAERLFVLKPLSEISGDAKHPIFNTSYQQLLFNLEQKNEVSA